MPGAVNASYDLHVAPGHGHFKVVHHHATHPELGCLRDYDEVERCDGGTWRAALANLLPFTSRQVGDRLAGFGPLECPLCPAAA
jgi:hypothetical protein